MLRIHFLNVGHGDCTIIEHPSGRLTVIDINNGEYIDYNSYEEIRETYAPSVSPGLIAGLGGHSARSLSSGGIVAALAGSEFKPHSALAAALLYQSEPYRSRTALAETGYTKQLTNPIEYLEQLCLLRGRDKTIFRYIQTHPDMDHMRGLTALLDHGFEIVNFWDTENTKAEPDFNKVINDDKSDWETYQKLRKGDGVARLAHMRGAVGTYWNQGVDYSDLGDGIEILAPTSEIAQAANSGEKHNNHSYVLRIKYAGVSIILGGDAESEVWEDIVNAYGIGLKCTVLKASHHGRDSGYYQPAVRLMNPELTLVSVGKKPETCAANKYKNYSDKVLTTRLSGNIVLNVWPDGTARYEEQYNT